MDNRRRFIGVVNDIGNMNRLIMTKQGRYYDETPYRLEEKLVKNIWWLLELSHRLHIDVEQEIIQFLMEKEKLLSIKNDDV